jgi:hypothetical protein
MLKQEGNIGSDMIFTVAECRLTPYSQPLRDPSLSLRAKGFLGLTECGCIPARKSVFEEKGHTEEVRMMQMGGSLIVALFAYVFTLAVALSADLSAALSVFILQAFSLLTIWVVRMSINKPPPQTDTVSAIFGALELVGQRSHSVN